MEELELRTTSEAWPELDFEIRSEGDGLNFRGYAAVFNSASADLGGFTESIRPGAFARSLNAAANGKRDIKMFLNHNQDVVLASTRAKTLRLAEDERGLFTDADLPAGVWGQPVAEAVRRGDISAMSFGFQVPPKGDSWNGDHTQRELHDVRLMEVSPVTGWPAYSATSASVRSIVSAIDWTDEDAVRVFIENFTDEQREIVARLLHPAPLPTPNRDRLEAFLAKVA